MIDLDNQKSWIYQKQETYLHLTKAALFGKLREHEIEMQKLNELESSEKRVKNITLNSSIKNNEESYEEVLESSENENLNVLVKRFGKFVKGRGTKGN